MPSVNAPAFHVVVHSAVGHEAPWTVSILIHTHRTATLIGLGIKHTLQFLRLFQALGAVTPSSLRGSITRGTLALVADTLAPEVWVVNTVDLGT